MSNSVGATVRRGRGAAGAGEDGVAEDAASRAPARLHAQASADESTEDLLRRYRLRGSPALRDRVVERHRGVVESMAHGLALRLPRSVDAQDLVHAGMWGLMQAIASYEPERCEHFQPFMRIRVRGAMLDELRHLDFVPRLLRRRLRERNEARARLRMELEREPTDSELAAALGISEAALLRRCEPSMWRIVRGDEGDPDEERCESLADEGVESPIEALTRRELLELIRSSLDRVEWRVLQLHYLEGLNGKQVARRLRLSPSRICQIHGRVLAKLKERLDV
ncbi:MAG: sigma-70 family RNA polymerase sigma factor [Planctomycetes bacterium]|nr:sigma-70 family RNA polymerase sigma factor [Planctomycetota bacterium]